MKKKKHLTRSWAGYAFLAPWLIGLFGLTLFPMMMSLYYSFTDFDMMRTPNWVGFANYIKLFTGDVKFVKSIKVTAVFVFISVPLQLAFALLIAIMLKKDRRGIKVYRALFYLPSLFGSSVAIAILWKQIFNKEGLLNQILKYFNVEGINWISTPSTVIYTLIILQVWQFGSSMIIFLSSLKQIPEDYYEAARIDGAGKVRQFFSITFPLLTPMVFFNVVMTFINAFQSFTSSYIISGGTGNPANATLFYSLYIYLNAFMHFKMGYASAQAWILLVFISIFTAILFLTSRKWVFYE